jgi:alkylhydroperoxidase family enzyme
MTDVLREAASVAGLTLRQKGVLVAATASTRADSYCSLAWGTRLADAAGADVAVAVLRGDDDALDPAERALARWARQVARDPNGTTPDDVRALREAGFDDGQILALTVYVAGRMAFSAVNGALGARPDAEYRTLAPEPVLSAVDYGRPVAGA